MGKTAFASALSTDENSAAALDALCRECRPQLDGPPDLALLLFMSSHHAGVAAPLADKLVRRLGAGVQIGGTGETIVGRGREVEMAPAMSLWIAQLPDVQLEPIHLEFERTPEGGTIVGWPDDFLSRGTQDSALLLIGDPFSFPADLLLERMNEDHPGVPIVGGMCSAGQAPGLNRLILDATAKTTGAVAVSLEGIQMRTVVSQGCRPIGEHFVITDAERNVIRQLGGLPAYERLMQVYAKLATHEQELLRRGLHVGRVVSEYQDQFEQGDFLVRNVVAVDPDAGTITIGDFVRPGQTVQFHLRDAETADGELQQLLGQVKRDGPRPAAGLLFTCNGRGTRLFSEPDHDANAVQAFLGEIPLAGFSAAGEIGPIGGRNFLHGFTASLALFPETT